MKTTLIKKDFTIQALLVLANLILSVITIIDLNQVFILLLLQLGTAAYLLISGAAGFLIAQRTNYFNYRAIFYSFSVIYLLVLISGGIYTVGNEVMFLIAFVIVPQLLVYTYCYLSYKMLMEQFADRQKARPIELTVLF